MKVIIDTPIWSLAFRRPGNKTPVDQVKYIDELKELISETRALILGPIRQEILSGINHPQQFKGLKEKLWAFENHHIDGNDYECAADFYNQCRKKGVQGSHIDFLICAVAYNNNFPIFTLDKDFVHYQSIVPIELYTPR